MKFEVFYLKGYGVAVAGYHADNLEALVEKLKNELFWGDVICIKDGHGQIYADLTEVISC